MTYAVFQTLAVYGLTTIIMYALSKKSYKCDKETYMMLAILVYSIVFGMRYCVGRDYMAYVEMFEHKAFGYEVDKEAAFVEIIKLFASLGLDVSAFFTFCAFFQLFFIFQAFKQHKEVYPYLILTFMIGGEWLIYSNIIRHIFAFAIFVYSLRFVTGRNPLKHYLWLFIAFFFHKSCAVLVIIYPLYLFTSSYFDRRWIQYVIVLISIVLMNLNYIQEFVSSMDKLLMLMGYYDKYIMDDRMDREVTLGIGFVIELAIACTIIYFSPKIKEHYTRLPVNIMYDMFIVGLAIKYSFIGSMMIQRMNVYFVGFTFILAGLELAYMFKFKRKGGIVLLGLYCFLGFATLYRMFENSALFIFNFQDNLFYLKKDF